MNSNKKLNNLRIRCQCSDTDKNVDGLLFKIWVLLQDDEAFHDGRERNIFFGGEFRPLAVRQKDRGRVRLEARDRLGLARLAHDIHRLKNETSFQSGV